VGQDKKRGLKGVLRVLHVEQHAPAHAQNHRPVPVEHGLEGGGVLLGEKAIHELTVGHVAVLTPEHDPLQAAKDAVQLSCRHVVRSLARKRASQG
jgi:hypothetical protein